MAKQIKKDVFRIYVDESEFDAFKTEIENAKKFATAKSGRTITDNHELFRFMLDLCKSQSEENLSTTEKNFIEVSNIIAAQMEKNLNDNEQAEFLNGDKAYINKAFITMSFVQDKIGCSLKPIKRWFDNPENQAKLDKHHALIKEKFGITETHNRKIKMLVKNRTKE